MQMDLFEVKKESEWTLKPEILTHPNIPKPLHGINPRTIMGKQWDIVRQQVYAKYNYHCVACGVTKENAKKLKRLEAHEYWDIDYMTGRCEVKSIEPLCYYCHSFIHSGRLQMIWQQDRISTEEVKDILEYGFWILSENNLKAFYQANDLAKIVEADTYLVDCYIPKINEKLGWNDFYLVFNGKEYRSNFKNISEWKEYYSKQ